MALSTYLLCCRTFSSSQTDTLSPFDTHSLSPWTTTPGNHRPTSVSMNLTPLGTSLKRNHTAFVFLWRTYFTEHNVLEVPPCRRMCQKVVPFEGWIIFRYVHAHILRIHSSINRLLGCFHLLTIVKQCCCEHGVQTSLRGCVFSPLVCIPRAELVGGWVIG